MIPIIIVSVFVLAAFIAFVIFLIKVILKAAKKEKPATSDVVRTVVSGVVWAILGCVNLVLIISVLIHGDPLLDKILNAGTDAASKALVYTFEGVEKNWNKDTLSKANKIGFEIMSVKKTEAKENDTYDFKLLLTNSLEKGKPISYWDLVSQNLLFGLDNNEVFYPVKIAGNPPEAIPTGKSYLSISIEVPKFAQLKEIGLGENKKPISK
jgi:hypothetical protein